MKCPKCGNDFALQVATKVNCDKCRILTTVTSVVTVQCEKCGHVFQVPTQGERFFSVKKDK